MQFARQEVILATVQIRWWWLMSSLLSNAQLVPVSWQTECNCQKHDRSKTVINIRIRRDYNPTSCQLISSPTSTTFACTQYKDTHVLIHLKNIVVDIHTQRLEMQHCTLQSRQWYVIIRQRKTPERTSEAVWSEDQDLVSKFLREIQ